jgi:hypothetical protein
VARRIDELPALALAPRLGGAELVVDERGHAGHLAQLPLHGVDAAAVLQLGAGGELELRVAARVLAHQHDARDALGGELARDLRDLEIAVERQPDQRLDARQQDAAALELEAISQRRRAHIATPSHSVPPIQTPANLAARSEYER